MLVDQCNGTSDFDKMLASLSEYCDKPFSYIEVKNNDTASVDDDEPYHWSYYNSLFFSLITLSTVGYGNLTPSSEHGKLLVIFYSIFGIPYLSIVIAQLGDYFGSVFLRAHHRYKNEEPSRCSLWMNILRYLIPGIVVFIVAPAGVISHMEQWSYIVSLYYSYVTLTTIGYGDIVAAPGIRIPSSFSLGSQYSRMLALVLRHAFSARCSLSAVYGLCGQLDDRSDWYKAYKVCLIIWIMFGLGYLAMIIGYIVKAMKSKKLNQMEKKLVNRLKKTQSKLWNEFTQDVSSIRRILNEIYLMKIKPVYKENCPTLIKNRLSQSCPNLSEWPLLRKKSALVEEAAEADESTCGWQGRRRANSEMLGGPPLHRVLSEGHLEFIDVGATFGASAEHPPNQLLADVVDVLEAAHLAPATSSSRSSDYDSLGTDRRKSSLRGINIFSDEEILASERQANFGSKESWGSNGWIIGGGDSTPPRRRRTYSATASNTYLAPHHPDQKSTPFESTSLHQLAVLNNMNMNGIGEIHPKIENPPSPPATPSGLRRVSVAAINFLSSNTQKLVKSVTGKGTRGAEEDEGFQEKDEDNMLRIAKEAEDGRRPSYGVNVSGENQPKAETPPVTPSGLRRVSVAAVNFLSSNTQKLVKSMSGRGEGEDFEESDEERIMRMVQEGEEGRRPSLVAALAADKQRMAPVLERTSMADFIRVMSSLKKMETGLTKEEGKRLRRKSRMEEEEEEAATKPSAARPPPGRPLYMYSSMRRRRSSPLSPVEMVQRRRRFSQVPNVSSSTLNSDEGFLGGPMFLRKRQTPSLMVTSPEGASTSLDRKSVPPKQSEPQQEGDLNEVISIRL
ncbi:hypothetical protein AAG570_009258 [Ranatra chinensis]|uniref:Potassium channel domain-containing protein n=1 Tax=Ranatra chinensis TaxID=642074 RepID=A0ABD0ZGI1_9HEMI